MNRNFDQPTEDSSDIFWITLDFTGRLKCLLFITCKYKEASHGEQGKNFKTREPKPQTLLLQCQICYPMSECV